jgi:hypothetical protein
MIDKLLHRFHVAGLDDRMAGSSIHEENNRTGILKGLGIAGPSISGHNWEDPGSLLQKLHEQGTARKELVLSGSMAGMTRHEHNLGQCWICRLNLNWHCRLISVIFVAGEHART